MSTRRGLASLLLVGALSLGCLSAEVLPSTHQRRSSTKKPQLAPLPSGPQGPVPQVPLDSIEAVAPQVSYRDGQLTIVAPNSTLGDILRAVRKKTAAEMEIPASASERVVTHLGPGPAREVVAELLNGSKFNYVLLGSPSDSSQLTRVVLVAKSGSDNSAPNGQQGEAGQPGNMAPPPPVDASADAPDVEPAAEDNPDDSNADQNAAAAEPEQPVADQPGARTPQQMLQEMQQRQLQMQQQMAPGQPPIPGGAGGIPRPPQEQQ